jgi:hypothetical protein
MPEDQNVAGDIWLEKSIEILDALGWEQGGDKKIDINTKIGEIGIDAFFTYYDPYEKCIDGCFLESKERKAKSVNLSFYSKTVKRVSDGLVYVPVSDEFNKKLNFNKATKVNSALLMVWISDDYNHNKYLHNLEKVEIPKKWQLQKIFIASNDDIKRFCSIIDTTKKILTNSETKEFNYYYPSLPGLKSIPERKLCLTLEYLYSKIIFGQLKICRIEGEDQKTKKITISYYFGEISLEGLKFLYDAFLKFQLLDEVFEVWIYLPAYNHIECHGPIEEFKRYFKAQIENQGKHINLIIKDMSPTTDDILSWRAK